MKSDSPQGEGPVALLCPVLCQLSGSVLLHDLSSPVAASGPAELCEALQTDAEKFVQNTLSVSPAGKREICANMFETVKCIHRLPHTVRLGVRFHVCAHLCVHVWGHTLTPLLLRKTWLHRHSHVLTSVLAAPSPGSPAPASFPLLSGSGLGVSWPLSVPVTPTAQASLLGPLGVWLWLRPVFHAEFTLFEQVAAVTSRGIGNWSDSKSITTTREKGGWFQVGRFRGESSCRGSSVPGAWGAGFEHHTAFPPTRRCAWVTGVHASSGSWALLRMQRTGGLQRPPGLARCVYADTPNRRHPPLPKGTTLYTCPPGAGPCPGSSSDVQVPVSSQELVGTAAALIQLAPQHTCRHR